jgi:hypothetical protein
MFQNVDSEGVRISILREGETLTRFKDVTGGTAM